MCTEYTVREVSEMLNTYPETIGRFIRSGQLKAHKKSGASKWFIFENDLDSFAEHHPTYGWRYRFYKRTLEEERLKKTDPEKYYSNKLKEALKGIDEMKITLDRHYRRLQRLLNEEEQA